jgi:type IV pilus assembly protein PilV
MNPSSQSGFSLIEVLVTMVLVAVSLLGLMGIQARSLAYQVDSFNGRTASDLIAQFRERMAANHQSYMSNIATTYQVTLDPGTTAPAAPNCTSNCNTPAVVAQRELALWYAEVQRKLPAPAVRLAPLTTGQVEGMNITLGWLESETMPAGMANGCDAIQSVATNARYRCVTMTFFPG